MAKQILRDQKLWLGGYDLSGVISSLALDYGAEARDVATLGAATRIQKAGLKTLAAQHEGFWDAAGGIDEELFGRVGLADAPMSFAATDAAEGDTAFSFLALFGEYSPGEAIGNILAFSVSAQAGDGDGLVRGTLMHNATRSASGNGTALQLGAVGDSQKLFGALHVLSAAGTTPTLDVVAESDDASGFASPTTRISFAQQTGIGFEWATPVAGPITDDWWRLSWTLGGAGPSFAFAGILAIQ